MNDHTNKYFGGKKKKNFYIVSKEDIINLWNANEKNAFEKITRMKSLILEENLIILGLKINIYRFHFNI